MPSSSKYARLKRSQVCGAILTIERDLLRVKPYTPRDQQLRAERAELFIELRKRDEALIKAWQTSHRCTW